MKLLVGAIWLVTAVVLVIAVGAGCDSAPPSGARVDPGEIDMLSDFSAALDERDPLERAFLYSRALRGLGPENVAEASALVEATGFSLDDPERRLLMHAWSRFDPAAALAWASSQDGRTKNFLESAAIAAWATRDPRGAVRALDAMEPDRKQALRAELVGGWANSGDIQGVTDYVFSLPKADLRPRLARSIVLVIQSQGLDALVEWAESVPEDGSGFDKEAAFRTATVELVRADPKRAIDFFEAHRERPYAPQAIKAFALRWVDHHDPAELFEWLMGLPADKTRDDGIRSGFSRWWETDPSAAAAWLAAAGPEPVLDRAVAVMASNISRTSTQQGLEWAEKIQDERLRQQTLIPILRRWVNENPRAVRDWMAENEVPDEVREAIMRLPRYNLMEPRKPRGAKKAGG